MNQDIINEFLTESKEHLNTVEESLLILEQNSGDKDTINVLFRAIHSIKGGAGFFGFMKISELSHSMESLLYKARNDELTLNLDHINILFAGLDILRESFENPEEDINIEDILQELSFLIGPQEKSNQVEIKGKAFNREDTEFQKFKINEKELQNAVDKGMNIYAVRAYLQKDMHDKGKTPQQYTDQIYQLGYFIDSYLDFDNAPMDLNNTTFDMAFVFLFATVLDVSLVENGVEVDPSQIIRIDTSSYKKTLKIKGKEGQIIDIKEKGKEIDSELKRDKPQQKLENISSTEKSVQENKEISLPIIDTGKLDTENKGHVIDQKEAVLENKKKIESKEIDKKEVEKKDESEPDKEMKSSGASAKSKIQTQTDDSLRVKISRLNKLVNLAGELVLARNQLINIAREIKRDAPGLHGILQRINLVTTELQTEIMNTRMQPISLVFNKFPRIARDLSLKLGKKVRIEMEGMDVEVDKTIIEAISDPLTHLVRNVIDHGIEFPKDRTSKGKHEEGVMQLRAFHEGGLVCLEIIDDGKGIDPEVISEKAVKSRQITPEEARKLSDKEKINLIFLPGFSTAKEVTDVSGRGVGMDVVKTNIEKLGGSVDVDSKLGKGTNVKIILPLTLAIITALIVETENEKFAIPQVNIDELIRIKSEEFSHRIANVAGGQVLRIRGKLLPLIHLADSINLPRTFIHPVTEEILPEKRKKYTDIQFTHDGNLVEPEKNKHEGDRRVIGTQDVLRILIVKSGESVFGLIVDKILGSEEIVVKPMPQHFRHLKSYAGSTILGDGKVSLIIDVPGLADKNKLLFHETETIQSKQDYSDKYNKQETAEKVKLLIFDIGASERFAIPIELIERVDVLDKKLIEVIMNKQYSSYKGYSMRLINLFDFIPMQRSNQEVDQYRVVIPKKLDIPIGILIHNVIDIKETVIQLEDMILKQKGIIGSAIIDNKITLLLDLLTVISTAEPNSLKSLQRNKSKEDIQNLKVLLAEDTKFYARLVHDYLIEAGYSVIMAENGVEALEQLAEHKINLIVSDIEMPKMDGFQLLESIKEDSKLKHIPVVALTSLSDENIVKRGKAAGFKKWCVKVNKEELLKTVDEFILRD